MPLRQIGQPHWQRYFDRMSAALGAKRVEIDLVGPRLGSQPQARNIALTGLSYDGKDDVFAVTGDGLEHNIVHPRQIHVDQDLDSVHSLEVIDAAGNHHILTLKDALRLPQGIL